MRAVFLLPLLSMAILGFDPAAHAQDEPKPGASESDPAEPKEDPTPKNETTHPLLELASTYLASLEKGIVFGNTGSGLEVRVTLIPSALDYEVCQRLVANLQSRITPEELGERWKQDKEFLKVAKRLQRNAGFRAELIHPEKNAAAGRPNVHFLNASLPKVISVQFSRQTVPWEGGWKEPTGLEVKTVRVERHWTLRNGRRVPKSSPLPPDHPRAVFRGEKSVIWGVFPAEIVDKKAGTLSLEISDFDRFTGSYTDEHIVDLNNYGESLTRELSLRADKEMPLFFPQVPAALRGQLDRWYADLGLKK